MNCRQPCAVFSLALLFASAVVARSQGPTTTEKPSIPTVMLSKQHEELCKVKVSDAFPALELTTLRGGAQSLPEAYGKQATVVLFWHGNGWMARAALRDLGNDIAEPFRMQGVAVVTIAVNQAADATQAALDQTESQLTTLLDPEGKAFAQVGSEKLPRMFVLDGAGKIVWFDLDYSNSTRRELKQAVQAILPK